MALRMTRRDTYGGERGWQHGAGVSWTDPDGGGEQQWREREPLIRHPAPEDPDDNGTGGRTGVFHRIAVGLGLRRPGPKGYKRSDERIREDICEQLWDAHDLDVGEVSVHVADGGVTLEGTVPHRHMKHHIEDIAAAAPGVDDVDNKIRVVRPE